MPTYPLAMCPVPLVNEPDTWLAKMLCPMLLLEVVEAAIPLTPTYHQDQQLMYQSKDFYWY